MKPLDRLGDRERAVIDERRATGYRHSPLEHFGDTEDTLRALLDQLLPGVPTTIDLAAFVDQHADDPMGRGDRPPGVPAEPELFARGLAALAELGFTDMTGTEQHQLVGRMRHGQADEDLDIPAKVFVDRLLEKALAGYLAHPDTWTRIGFTGPAYPEGYAWIGPAEAKARHARAPGWDRL